MRRSWSFQSLVPPPEVNVKPIPFLAALVPTLAALVFIAALRRGFEWYNAAALFYGALTLAEMAYLGTVFAVNGARPQMFQERSAKTGVIE